MRTVPRGIAATNHFDATDTDTAAAVGNPGVEAVATVALILWIEATCGELMAPYLDEGEAGVGVRVAVDHTGPAFASRPVEVHARVSGVDRRQVTFSVRLAQDGRDVMTGEHVRVVVDLARFLGARTENAIPPAKPVTEPAPTSATDSATKSATMPPVTFYFDVHSPWSYLASVLIGPLARRHDARIEWRPLHLANLMDRIDGLRPLEQTPARVAWYEQDIADRMAQHGVPYDPHPDYPAAALACAPVLRPCRRAGH